jgi:aminoglycoside phosphotransferase (APT) family kinase protein
VAAGTLLDRSTWRYLILKPLPDRPIREVKHRMPRADLLAAMRVVGATLRRIHAIPVPPGVPALNLPTLIRRAVQQYREAGVFPPSLIRDFRRKLPELTASPGRRRTLLHADPYEDHLIMNRWNSHWRATGVIDFADAAAGDPMYEWMPIRLGFRWTDPTFFMAAVRTRYPGCRMTDRRRDRAAAFMVIHRFGPRALLDRLKRESVRTKTMTWADLRNWLLPA